LIVGTKVRDRELYQRTHLGLFITGHRRFARNKA